MWYPQVTQISINIRFCISKIIQFIYFFSPTFIRRIFPLTSRVGHHKYVTPQSQWMLPLRGLESWLLVSDLLIKEYSSKRGCVYPCNFVLAGKIIVILNYSICYQNANLFCIKLWCSIIFLYFIFHRNVRKIQLC